MTGAVAPMLPLVSMPQVQAAGILCADLFKELGFDYGLDTERSLSLSLWPSAQRRDPGSHRDDSSILRSSFWETEPLCDLQAPLPSSAHGCSLALGPAGQEQAGLEFKAGTSPGWAVISGTERELWYQGSWSWHKS